MTITPDVFETLPGGNVILTITEKNTGEWPLDSIKVTLTYGAATIELSKASASYTGGDTGNDGILSPNETWTWVLDPIMISTDTTFTVNGYGKAVGFPEVIVDFAHGYTNEKGSVLVEVGGATRTWGFWKTHLYLVDYMFGGSAELDPADPFYRATPIVSLPINLGTWNGQPKLIDSVCKYMGLMWSSQTQNSDGTTRTKLDQARIHTAHQALAAIMNYYMPGGAPLPAGITLESIAQTLSNGNEKAIRTLGTVLAAYNESGDHIALDPSLPPTGKTNNADPQGARDIGALCEVFWDTPPANGKNN